MSAQAFTKFINATIGSQLDQLTDLNPVQLDLFIQALCKKNHIDYVSKVKKETKNRWEDLENINISLTYLSEQHKMPLINVSSEALLDGKDKEKILLGFIWNIIYMFQVKRDLKSMENKPEIQKEIQELEEKYMDLNEWLKEILELEEITDYSKSWADGQLLGYLLQRMTGEDLKLDEQEDILTFVLDYATNTLGIPQLVSAEELSQGADKNNVMMYLSLFRDAFLEEKLKEVVIQTESQAEEVQEEPEQQQPEEPVEEQEPEEQQPEEQPVEDFFQQEEEPVQEEVNPLVKARKERYERIDKMDAESRVSRQRRIMEADEYKKKKSEEREHRIQVSHGTNTDEEQIFKNSLTDESENAWEKVVNLSEWNIEQQKDVLRLKKLYLNLKNTPPVAKN